MTRLGVTRLGTVRLRARTWLAFFASATALILLSGCGLGIPFLSATEPPDIESALLEEQRLLQASLKGMPVEMVSALPNGHALGAARFLTRTLETAPDGDRRRWQSFDRTITVFVQPSATAFSGDTLCRNTLVTIESPLGIKKFEYRACRLKNGTWAQQL